MCYRTLHYVSKLSMACSSLSPLPSHISWQYQTWTIHQILSHLPRSQRPQHAPRWIPHSSSHSTLYFRLLLFSLCRAYPLRRALWGTDCAAEGWEGVWVGSDFWSEEGGDAGGSWEGIDVSSVSSSWGVSLMAWQIRGNDFGRQEPDFASIKSLTTTQRLSLKTIINSTHRDRKYRSCQKVVKWWMKTSRYLHFLQH